MALVRLEVLVAFLVVAFKSNDAFECPSPAISTSHYQFPTRNGSVHLKCVSPLMSSDNNLDALIGQGNFYSPYLMNEVMDDPNIPRTSSIQAYINGNMLVLQNGLQIFKPQGSGIFLNVENRNGSLSFEFSGNRQPYLFEYEPYGPPCILGKVQVVIVGDTARPTNVTEIVDVWDCQTLCQISEECFSYTYFNDTSVCLLYPASTFLSSDYAYTEHEHGYVGAKSCGLCPFNYNEASIRKPLAHCCNGASCIVCHTGNCVSFSQEHELAQIKVSSRCINGVQKSRVICSGYVCKTSENSCFDGFDWTFEDWSECSATCGIGVKQRKLTCISPNRCGNDTQERIEHAFCNLPPCSIDLRQLQSYKAICPDAMKLFHRPIEQFITGVTFTAYDDGSNYATLIVARLIYEKGEIEASERSSLLLPGKVIEAIGLSQTTFVAIVEEPTSALILVNMETNETSKVETDDLELATNKLFYQQDSGLLYIVGKGAMRIDLKLNERTTLPWPQKLMRHSPCLTSFGDSDFAIIGGLDEEENPHKTAFVYHTKNYAYQELFLLPYEMKALSCSTSPEDHICIVDLDNNRAFLYHHDYPNGKVKEISQGETSAKVIFLGFSSNFMFWKLDKSIWTTAIPDDYKDGLVDVAKTEFLIGESPYYFIETKHSSITRQRAQEMCPLKFQITQLDFPISLANFSRINIDLKPMSFYTIYIQLQTPNITLSNAMFNVMVDGTYECRYSYTSSLYRIHQCTAGTFGRTLNLKLLSASTDSITVITLSQYSALLYNQSSAGSETSLANNVIRNDSLKTPYYNIPVNSASSIFSSQREINPWLNLDLGNPRVITAVLVTLHAKRYTRIHARVGFEIPSIEDEHGMSLEANNLCGIVPIDSNEETGWTNITIDCNGTLYGRFLTIQQLGELPEVFEVFEVLFEPTPKHCEWTEWSDWLPCNKSQGTWEQVRERVKIHDAFNAGLPCSGSTEEKNSSNCKPENGNWTEWSEWTECTFTHNKWEQQRSRNCSNPPPRYDGFCPGSNNFLDTATQTCDPIPGNWTEWTSWTECAPDDYEGWSRYRSRNCSNPPPEYGGSCDERELLFEETIEACEAESGNWTEWTEWTDCKKDESSVGKHWYHQRSRNCSNPPPRFGGTCPDNFNNNGSLVEEIIELCPSVPGNWTAWSNWTECSPINIGNRTGQWWQWRSRNCSDPAPAFGGMCPSNNNSLYEEDFRLCPPIHGIWTNWSDISQCSATCGESSMGIRTRSCEPKPQFGGEDCVGNTTMIDTCSDYASIKCPIHGGWSEFGNWTECSQTCDTGERRRIRNCSNPEPKFGGNNCQGQREEVEDCNTHPCFTRK